MNLETKITIYKFTPQVFTLTRFYVDPVNLYFVGIHKRKAPKIIDFQSFSSIYFSDSYTLRDSNPGPTD